VIVDRLDPIDPSERARLLGRLGDPSAHAAAMASLPALRQVEVGGSADGELGNTFTVVAWNLERGAHVDAAAEVLQGQGPDLVLASELDIGMARSGNRHTVAELAGALGHRYAFAVEFLELGLGDEQEAARLGAGATNELGFHGNAITAHGALADPTLIRIEDRGSWFHPGTDEPRVGGRMALAARIDLPAGPLVVCSLHLESESGPALRAEQLGVVLGALDEHYGPLPCVVGGDLNTFSGDLHEVRSSFRSLRQADPTRFCWPVPYEPLFEVASAHGFDVDDANAADQTMRTSADQRPGSLLRLDWLLVRDLEVIERSTIPAVDRDRTVISDHDGVAATLRHRNGNEASG
jgi:endonuclease/exonuclease/phosphatase family metal-dependent hydrolase